MDYNSFKKKIKEDSNYLNLFETNYDKMPLIEKFNYSMYLFLELQKIDEGIQKMLFLYKEMNYFTEYDFYEECNLVAEFVQNSGTTNTLQVLKELIASESDVNIVRNMKLWEDFLIQRV